jgi:cobalt/nickel transport system permease protein
MKTAAAIFGDIEAIAQRHSWIHDRDARAKIIVAFLFIITLVSFDNRSVSSIVPLALLPISWASVGSISLRWLCRQIATPLLFLAVFALANALFDRSPHSVFFGITITGGIISWCSIVLRAALSLAIVLLLIATTGMARLLDALVALKMPILMIITLQLIYRYIFVLEEEAIRINRARNSRSFGQKGLGISVAVVLLGQLLLKSLSRAERIHNAMVARGFSEQSFAACSSAWRVGDSVVIAFSCLFLVVVRFGGFSELVGRIILGLAS